MTENLLGKANVEADYNLYNNTDSFSGEQGATATLHFYGVCAIAINPRICINNQ
jgi:hypothetical protein